MLPTKILASIKTGTRLSSSVTQTFIGSLAKKTVPSAGLALNFKHEKRLPEGVDRSSFPKNTMGIFVIFRSMRSGSTKVSALESEEKSSDRVM